MASHVRKKSGAGWLFFWLAFILGVTLLFMFNLERIKATLAQTNVLNRPPAEEEEAPPDGDDVAESDTAPAVAAPVVEAPPDAPAGPAAVERTNPRTVDRNLYLLRIDNDGAILQTRVTRSLPSSDSPLRDTIDALIRGPAADEAKKGLRSLIPAQTRLLGATVRGSTAYLNFNEEFLFNQDGIEGYVGQRRQIVLTATEFSNIKDVQILIDGKRQDYLGEGIWIGSPISKDML
ncbi:MAG: GerMN domain-containing protein [Treponema sp.]|jgi:spore germination protein GerM|nr:GerMN domain-containing protein [Treponema sp.]